MRQLFITQLAGSYEKLRRVRSSERFCFGRVSQLECRLIKSYGKLETSYEKLGKVRKELEKLRNAFKAWLTTVIPAVCWMTCISRMFYF